jgi:hypothetical protein
VKRNSADETPTNQTNRKAKGGDWRKTKFPGPLIRCYALDALLVCDAETVYLQQQWPVLTEGLEVLKSYAIKGKMHYVVGKNSGGMYGGSIPG